MICKKPIINYSDKIWLDRTKLGITIDLFYGKLFLLLRTELFHVMMIRTAISRELHDRN